MSTGAELTLGQELLKLLPIVAGAILAMLGGGGTQLLVHRLGAERERRKVLREKGEALIRALHAYPDWISSRMTTMVFKNEDHDVPSPLDEAWTIQQIYFPELSEPILSVLESAEPLVQWIGEERIKRLNNEATWLNTFDRAPYDAMYERCLRSSYKAGDNAAKLVRDHMQS